MFRPSCKWVLASCLVALWIGATSQSSKWKKKIPMCRTMFRNLCLTVMLFQSFNCYVLRLMRSIPEISHQNTPIPDCPKVTQGTVRGLKIGTIQVPTEGDMWNGTLGAFLVGSASNRMSPSKKPRQISESQC